jgi:hypothetical protein
MATLCGEKITLTGFSDSLLEHSCGLRGFMYGIKSVFSIPAETTIHEWGTNARNMCMAFVHSRKFEDGFRHTAARWRKVSDERLVTKVEICSRLSAGSQTRREDSLVRIAPFPSRESHDPYQPFGASLLRN